MKIAFSSTGQETSDNIADLFGRCPYFVVVTMDGEKIVKTEALKNENENQVSGAGVSVAKFLVENDVNVVIAKSVGPRALDVLKQFQVDVYNEEGTISDVLQKFIDKRIKK